MKQLIDEKTNKIIFQGTKQQILDYVKKNYNDNVWICNCIKNNNFTVKSFAMAVCAMWQIGLDVI